VAICCVKSAFHTLVPCNKCAAMLMIDNGTDVEYSAFIKQKTFYHTAALLCPSPAMSKFVKQSGAIFIQMFPHVQHGVNILNRTFVYVANNVAIVGRGDQCCCNRVQQMIKLHLHV